MGESSATPILDVRDLSVTLPLREGPSVHALRGISLVVERGSCVAVVGESGAGKTMLARAILGLLPPAARSAGEVLLEGRSLSTLTPAARRAVNGARIGMVFQEPLAALDPLFSVGEHIKETLVAHRHVSRRDAHQKAIAILERMGLSAGADFARALPSRLSGGERQRALIATAIACEPTLLIADEPTTALDPTTEREILALLDDERARSGAGVLFITHDLQIASAHADEIVVLFAGTVVERGAVADVLRAPRHPYTRALCDAMPGARRRDVDGEPLPLPAPYARSVDVPAHDDGHVDGMATVITEKETGCVYRPRCAYASALCAAAPPLVSRAPKDARVHDVACHHPLAVRADVSGGAP